MKDEYNLDYLKLSFQSQENRERYKEKTENSIKKKGQNVLDKINKGCFDQLEYWKSLLSNSLINTFIATARDIKLCRLNFSLS